MPSSRQFQLGLHAALAVGTGLFAARTARAVSGRLLVFLHLPMKQRALQKILSGALVGAKVTAVGRIADFDRALAAGQDAVLSLPIVLSARGLSPKLAGSFGGSQDEAYSLVAAGARPNPATIEVVGALDVLGRAGTNLFVSGVMGAKPKVKRVTKVEDLLPLLQMQVAEAILVPTRLIPAIQETSRLGLMRTDLETRVRLPAVASVGPSGPALVAAISRLPTDLNRKMRVDAWR